ncbi:MAG: chemotaxis protein CheA [Deltaproteobacteria bacterium]|nr:chemotaxis protein CheA [Deltaproteobacteria bacterium]
MDSKSVPPGLQDFLSEAQEILEGLGSELLSLDRSGDSATIDPDMLNSIFRRAHSLKGLAGMFGLMVISDVAHHMEDVLDDLRLGKVSLEPGILDLLFEGVEFLTRILADLESEKDEKKHQDRATEYLERLKKVVFGSKKGGSEPDLSDLDSRIIDVLTEYEEHRLKENLKQGRNLYLVHSEFDLMSFDQRLTDINKKLKSRGEVISTLPSATPGDENSIKFDLLYGTELDIEQVQKLVAGEGISVSQASSTSVKTKKTDSKESQPLDSTVPKNKPPDFAKSQALVQTPADDSIQSGVPRGVGHTVRVDIRKLDELMEIVGELVLSQLALKQIYFDLERGKELHTPLMSLFREQRVLERKILTLRDAVLTIRMVPLGPTFDKVARIVRRICRENGKEVRLEISGGDTELDKMIVEEVGDPLVHMIRNCLDHGIEPPSVRKKNGKPEIGVVRLSARQHGSHVVLEVSDDGAGIDLDQVRSAAIKRGMVTPERARELDEHGVLDLLFVPGMTTNDKVSELSGRGVGLDVVKENISNMSGLVEVETQKGKGTTFRATLPMTLAIIRAMLVGVSGRTYALPLTSIQESVAVGYGDIDNVGGSDVFEYRGTTLPVLRLSEFFKLTPLGHSMIQDRLWTDEGGQTYMVVVGLAEKKLGLMVDRLLGEQDLVIKPLGPAFKGIKSFAGAAELADKSTILVLDTAGLMEVSLDPGGANG